MEPRSSSRSIFTLVRISCQRRIAGAILAPMKWVSLVALVAGGATIVAFAWMFDRPAIAAALLASAPGIAAICACRVVSLIADTVGWSVLIPGRTRPPLATLIGFRWMSKSINVLLPAMQIGGDLVRASMLRRSGTAADAAGASVLVDVTLGFAAQVAFTLMGIAAFTSMGDHGSLTAPLVVAVAFGSACTAALFLMQRLGLLRTCARAARRLACRTPSAAAAERVAAAIDAIDRAAITLYRSGAAVIVSTLSHLAAWLLRTADTLIALYFMGATIGLREAVVIESLTLAVRSAAFVIPAGLGAQEGAIVVLAGAFGLPAETALALALVKRLQEIIVFGPGLAAWWLHERRTSPHRPWRQAHARPVPGPAEPATTEEPVSPQ